ncbi:MAG TPA: glycosyltransferase [Halobacteriales archaeon]|nr:glycosyltransferase [Halobacteriales archaeon]
MRVLRLVTTPEKSFFEGETAALEAAGVDLTTVPVPGENTAHSTDATGSDYRSALDYLRHAASTFRHSFGDYDLVHASYGLTGPAALAQPNLPVVLTLWGSDLMGRFGPVSRWCARRSDAVIVMSGEMAETLGQPCHVIPHGIDIERFSPRPPEAARAELGWSGAARHVFFPYPRKRAVKDFPRAERVVARVRERLDAPVELHVAEGIPYDRMPLHMNAADALLLTSEREGMPNTVKEALACDLPVVSTDVGDVAAWLEAVEPSAVERTDDELAAALADVLSRRERSNGREAVRQLAWPRVADRILGVYRSVVEGVDAPGDAARTTGPGSPIAGSR